MLPLAAAEAALSKTAGLGRRLGGGGRTCAGLLDGLDLPVDPETDCPRAQVVMLLYRLLA